MTLFSAPSAGCPLGVGEGRGEGVGKGAAQAVPFTRLSPVIRCIGESNGSPGEGDESVWRENTSRNYGQKY